MEQTLLGKVIVVDTIEKFKTLKEGVKKTPFLYLQLYSDINKHPLENRVSCYYILSPSGNEYIVPVNHIESVIDCSDKLETDQKVAIYDLKSIEHNAMIVAKNKYDLNWNRYIKKNQPVDTTEYLTNAHNFYYRTHYDKENVNDIIPLVKHLEYFKALGKELMDYLETDDDQTILTTLGKIEKSGLQTTEKLVYSEYNPFTSTGRPSNRFGGMNFAALNKNDGSRRQFVSRFKDGWLVEFDFDAYHPRLIGEKLKYDFPKGSVHEHFAKLYGVDYDESKALTFKYMYGTVPPEMRSHPFFGKVHKYVMALWDKFIRLKSTDFLLSDIYNRKIYRKNLLDMNPNKLFNYMIQLMETENNIKVLSKLLPEIKNYSSKLILYNYDSFLFDFDVKNDKMGYLKKIKVILEQDGKYPTKIKVGQNYHEMNDITEKLV